MESPDGWMLGSVDRHRHPAVGVLVGSARVSRPPALADGMKPGDRRKIRRSLAAMFGWACAICGHELVEPLSNTDVFRDEAPDGKRWATLDHMVPKAMGGRDAIHNLQLCCPPCNNKKGNQIG